VDTVPGPIVIKPDPVLLCVAGLAWIGTIATDRRMPDITNGKVWIQEYDLLGGVGLGREPGLGDSDLAFM
jgi:hypothetical protein